MRARPDLACDRVYAVTGRNNFVTLYLSSLACAKVITGSINLSLSTVGLLCTISLRSQIMEVISYTARGHPNRGVQDMHRKWATSSPGRSASYLCRFRQVIQLPLHHCQSFTAGRIRHFRIQHYHLLCEL